MHRLFYLFIFFSICQTSFPKALVEEITFQENRIIDSTNQSINKLEQLRKNSIESKSDDKYEAIQALLSEAKKQNNLLYETVAYQHLAVYNSFIPNQMDSATFYIYKALEVFNKISVEENKNQLYNRVGTLLNESLLNILMSQNKKESALLILKNNLEKAQKTNSLELEQSAFSSLGYLYWSMGIHKQALECYDKSLEVIKNLPENLQKGRIFDIYFMILILCDANQEYDKVIAYSDTLTALSTNSEQMNIRSRNWEVMHHLFYANAYIGNHEIKKARLHLDSCAIMLKKSQNIEITINYQEAEAKYYYNTKEYAKSLIYINKFFEVFDINDINNLPQTESLRLLYFNILNKTGNHDESFNQLNKLYNTKDSINKINFASQVAEIETIYQVEKLKDMSKLSALKYHKLKIQFIFSSLLVLFIVAILIMIWYGHRRRKINKLVLEEKERELNLKELKIQEMKEMVIDITTSIDPHQEIMDKLDAYMISSQAYRNPKLTRNEVAIQVGTNRQYLIDAIKNIKGQTFNEYIYTWRLEYAYHILATDATIPIAIVQEDSGFTSQPVFNTTFKNVYGISPSELRKSLIDKKDLTNT